MCYLHSNATVTLPKEKYKFYVQLKFCIDVLHKFTLVRTRYNPLPKETDRLRIGYHPVIAQELPTVLYQYLSGSPVYQ